MKSIKLLLVLVLILSLFVSCATKETLNEQMPFDSWEQVLDEGQGKDVTILMWGGNEGINQFMDGYVADHVKEKYGITLNRVPMNAPEFMSKLLNRKKR